MKHFSKVIFSAFIGTLLLTSCSGNDSLEEDQLYQSTSLSTKESPMESEVFQLVNEYRLSQGLNTLQFSQEGYNFAQEHTQYMIEVGNINHDDFDRRAAQLSDETRAVHVGENVGRNFSTAAGIVEAWSKSAAHKKVMEGNYSLTAISAIQDSEGNFYFTQVFIKK